MVPRILEIPVVNCPSCLFVCLKGFNVKFLMYSEGFLGFSIDFFAFQDIFDKF